MSIEVEKNFLNLSKTYTEEFFSKRIYLGNIEVYPYYVMSLRLFKVQSLTNVSIKPIAIIIKEKTDDSIEYYLHIIDNEYENNVDEIILNFVNEFFK